MRFRPGARLDPSQIEDVRGSGGGFAFPGGGMVAGGGLGVVGLIIYLAFALGGGTTTTPSAVGTQSLAQECATGADANAKNDCSHRRRHQQRAGLLVEGRPNYTIAKTVFFTGSTPTGCGQATTDVGPFYCPADTKVYIDLGFFDELKTRSAAATRRLHRRTCSRTNMGITSRT